MPTTLTPEVSEGLVTEINAALVENVKNARESILKAHHDVGEILHRYSKNGAKITELVQSAAKSKVTSESTLWSCYRYYEAFPEFESTYATHLGQSVSWNKIKQLLAGPKPECKHEESERITRCRKCHALV